MSDDCHSKHDNVWSLGTVLGYVRAPGVCYSDLRMYSQHCMPAADCTIHSWWKELLGTKVLHGVEYNVSQNPASDHSGFIDVLFHHSFPVISSSLMAQLSFWVFHEDNDKTREEGDWSGEGLGALVWEFGTAESGSLDRHYIDGQNVWAGGEAMQYHWSMQGCTMLGELGASLAKAYATQLLTQALDRTGCDKLMESAHVYLKAVKGRTLRSSLVSYGFQLYCHQSRSSRSKGVFPFRSAQCLLRV